MNSVFKWKTNFLVNFLNQKIVNLFLNLEYGILPVYTKLPVIFNVMGHLSSQEDWNLIFQEHNGALLSQNAVRHHFSQRARELPNPRRQGVMTELLIR